ncbi:MAG: HAD family hydrolase [Deltaproteobacteria bacterium]|nr:HAD family hydrolase [Deltaproteobacteria bacterium]
MKHANQIKALLFDIDNTLVNRDYAFTMYIKDFVKRNQNSFGSKCYDSVIEEILQIDDRGRFDRSLFIEKILGMFPGLNMSKEEFWADHKTLPDFVRNEYEVQEMIKRLKEDYNLAIVSNGSGDMQRMKMRYAGLESLFTEYFISGEIGIEKPDSKIFTKALDSLKCLPEDAVMIGDDMDRDILGAKKTGIKTIMISSAENRRKNADKNIADIVIDNILELEKVLPCLI